MPDFKAYVRGNLPPLGVSAARELEIVEEVALEFEERYNRALRNGLDPEQAWQEVKDHARPWSELRQELVAALGEQQNAAEETALGSSEGSSGGRESGAHTRGARR